MLSRTRISYLALMILWLSVESPRALGRQPDIAPTRVVVARVTSDNASISSREPGANTFKVLPEKSDLFAGDMLVTLPGASLTGLNGAIAVKSLADYDGRSPLPAIETAFSLSEPIGVDLSLVLSRGRIDLTNIKEEGSTTVLVRFWDQSWKITLEAPRSRVGLELFSRWPPGSRFKPATATEPSTSSPVASLAFLVIQGSATVEIAGQTVSLRSPPGPALMEWDSVTGTRPQPQKLEVLPKWADPTSNLSGDGQKIADTVELFRRAQADNPTTAIPTFLASKDPIEQRVALITLAATDDLLTLGQELSAAKSTEEWDFGIRILRHWLGRSPGQDQKLYDALISPVHGYSPAHARIIMRLLFGFSSDEMKQPETYEVLLDYLVHDQKAIRNLAAWHLVRLLPVGKTVTYSPGGSKLDCEKLRDFFKKSHPTGQFPPESAKKD